MNVNGGRAYAGLTENMQLAYSVPVVQDELMNLTFARFAFTFRFPYRGKRPGDSRAT